jgi:hypothetical protein
MLVPDPDGVPRATTRDTELRWINWLALLGFIAVLALGLARNNACLFMSLDGTAWRITLDAQAADRTAFSQSGVDPYQGSFDAYYPAYREYLVPSALSMLVGSSIPGKTATYTIYAAFLLIASYLMARSIGFDAPTSLIGGFLLPCMALPFFLDNPGVFYPLFSLNPHITQIVGLSLLIVASFWALDASAGRANLLLIAVPCLCLMLAILSLVPYVALMVPATALYGGASFFSARRWYDNWPRLVAGLLMIAVPIALGALTYIHGLVGYTAYQFFSGEFEQTRANLIYASTIFWPGPFDKILIALGFVSALWLAVCRGGRIRLFAIAHLLITATYLVGAFVIVWYVPTYQGPSPVYFETCFWAYSLLFCAGALVQLVQSVVRLALWRRRPYRRLVRYGTYLPVALVIAAGLAFDVVGNSHKPNPCAQSGFTPVADTPITEVLKRSVALSAGMPFRGSVATIDSTGEKPPVNWNQLHSIDLSLWRATGNDHRIVGLWHFGIPTLFQYFTFITPPYYLLLTDFLARPADQQTRSVLVFTQIEARMLQLWGVRYLLTDSDSAAGTEVTSVRGGDLPRLRLLELPQPNLGNYSPTRVQQAPDFRTGLADLHAAGFDGSKTIITDASLAEPLVEAGRVSLIYEKDGFHISAESTGRSVLVLPAQYSHCWSASGQGDPRLFRADLMQLGVAFQDHLDAHLVFRFGPIYAGECRGADIADMNRLKIGAARDRLARSTP